MSRTSGLHKRTGPGMLGAVDIPWNPDFSLDRDHFRGLIRRLQTLGAGRLYIMGTAGEGYAMSDARFREVVDVFVEAMSGSGIEAQVGVISLSMDQIVERLEYAHGRGIRSFQISLPSWGALGDAEMMGFFKTVCGRFPDSEFLHYNLARTKRILTGGDYRRILDEVPNLVASKQSSADMNRVRDWMIQAPEMQHFMLETCFAYACQYGECSLLCSMHGAFPRLTREYFGAGRNGDLVRALEIAEKFRRHGEGLFGHLKRPMIDGAYDKLLVWLTDPTFPIRLLPPYEGFTGQEAKISLEYYRNHRDEA